MNSSQSLTKELIKSLTETAFALRACANRLRESADSRRNLQLKAAETARADRLFAVVNRAEAVLVLARNMNHES